LTLDDFDEPLRSEDYEEELEMEEVQMENEGVFLSNDQYIPIPESVQGSLIL
jgi:hypothetical protein